MTWRAEHLEQAAGDAQTVGDRSMTILEGVQGTADAAARMIAANTVLLASLNRDLARAIGADLESLARRIEGGIG